MAYLHPTDAVPPFERAAVFPAGVLVVAIGLGRYRRGSVRAADVTACGGAAILAAVFAPLAAVGTVSAGERLASTGHAVKVAGLCLVWAVPLALGLAVAAVVATWAASADVRRLRRRLVRVLVVTQLPLPLMWCYLLPPPLIDQTGRFPVRYPKLLAVTLLVAAAAGVWAVWRRLGRRVPTASLRRAVAPAALIALAVYVRSPSAVLPGPSRDYFHFGEQVLPWEQLWDFHKRPYVDFVPIHGLMAFYKGGVNQLFFDGTAAHYVESDVLLDGTVAAATMAAACWLLGPVGALVLIPMPLVEFDRLYLLPVGLFLVAAMRTWRRPAWGLLAWVAVCGLEVAYNASIGPAFVVGTAPVAVWGAARAGWRRSAAAAAVVVVLLSAAAAVPDVRATGVGFVRFVADNAWTNTAAHAVPWSAGAWQRDIQTGFGSSQALWETVRLGWMGVAVVGLAVAWRAMAGGRARPGAGLLGLSVALVLAITFPWTMGRIGGGAFSRPGSLSTTSVEYLLPALLLLAVPRRWAALAAVVAVMAAAAVQYGDATNVDPGQVIAKAAAVRVADAGRRVDDGAQLGLPGLGRVFAPAAAPGYPQDLAQLKRNLTRLLRPGETFLDLTEQQAIYFYLGLPVPVQYAAYVAANGRLQRTEERQLAAHPVPAVMIGPAAWIDGVPPSVRCYRLWRDYALRDVTVRLGDFTFLVDPQRAAAFGGQPVPPTDARPAPTEPELETLDTLMMPTDLQRLCVSWGRSWPTLRSEFADVGQGTVTAQASATDPWAVATVPTATVPGGAAADFVLLHVSLKASHPARYWAALAKDPVPHDTPSADEPEMVLQWQDAGGAWPTAAAHFKVHPGDLLVPLGAFPRWLLGQHAPAIRMCVLNAGAVRSWQLDGVTYLKLR